MSSSDLPKTPEPEMSLPDCKASDSYSISPSPLTPRQFPPLPLIYYFTSLLTLEKSREKSCILGSVIDTGASVFNYQNDFMQWALIYSHFTDGGHGQREGR